MVKLSIIVPCYGVEKFLDRCIESLLNQTLKDIEIILVDDESPDRVPEMIDGYALKDNRIKVVHKQNGGLGFARNSGLDIATGEFIAFVDSDDFVDTDMYEVLYNEAKLENAEVVFCNFQKETKDGRWNKCVEVKEKKIFKDNDVTNFMFDLIASAPYIPVERKYQMSVWHGIYKSSIIERHYIRFLSERSVASEDIPFNVEFLLNCNTVVYRPECYYHYCLNGSSLTSKFLPEKFERYKNLYNYLKNIISNYGSDGEIRLNRFFIGMIRTQILHLAEVNRIDKYEIYRKFANDEIWNDIMHRFKYSYLPLPAAILLYLLLHKQYILLFLFSRLYLKARN